MKRVFIAIDISSEARSKVSAYIDTLKRSARDVRVGWERPEKLHLTLKFLGDIDDNKVSDVEQALKKVAAEFSGFWSKISGTGRFPPKGDPRILWLGLVDDGATALLAQTLDRELSRTGFASEKRKFHPHLTIARLREPHRSVLVAAEHVSNEFETADFAVSELVIYESQLLPTGSVYRKLASFPLRAN